MKVLIIGAGPVGLTCAHLLGALKIPCTILERQSKLTAHPSAHFLHSRSMEIYDSLGIADKIYSQVPPLNHWRRFIYASSILGKSYRVHDHFSSRHYEKNQLLSPCQPTHFPQHKLVNLLYSSLPSTAEVLLSKEFSELSFNNGVTVKTLDGKSYQGDYVIACDGANSRVRNYLNIPLESSDVLQSFLNIHFISKKLGHIALSNPAMIYFIYNPEALVVIVMHNAQEGEFVMQVPFFPPLTNPSDYSQSEIKDLVEKCTGGGAKIDDIEIKSMKMWKMASRHATKLRHDKVFLAGDSAHSLTPAGGFGLNTGICDAHNLCWKFNFPSLLDSYSQERVPRIQQIIDKSYNNYTQTVKIAQNFGLDISYAKAFESFSSKLPFGSTFFKYGLRIGQKLLLNDTRAIEYLKNDDNLLNLIFPEEDLQFKYPSGYFLNGGELAPNSQVAYKGQPHNLRLLPGKITQDFKKAVFIKVIGKDEFPNFEYPTKEIKSPDDFSYILRPDGHVYWSSRNNK